MLNVINENHKYESCYSEFHYTEYIFAERADNWCHYTESLYGKFLCSQCLMPRVIMLILSFFILRAFMQSVIMMSVIASVILLSVVVANVIILNNFM